MIVLSYMPGIPLADLEYVLKKFTKEYNSDAGAAKLDGSMGRFFGSGSKNLDSENLQLSLENNRGTNVVLRVPYFMEHKTPGEIQNLIYENLTGTDHHIFISVENLAEAELIYLLDYRKTALMSWSGLDNFFIDCTLAAHEWNASYSDHSMMLDWELRECFSWCYPNIALVGIEAKKYLQLPALTITISDLLHNTLDTFKNVIGYCGLTMTSESDVDAWIDAQKKLQNEAIVEHQLINSIVDSVVNNQYFDWSADTAVPLKGTFMGLPSDRSSNPRLTTVGEAMVQHKLRSLGYNMLCSGLDQFPTNSQNLQAVLEKL